MPDSTDNVPSINVESDAVTTPLTSSGPVPSGGPSIEWQNGLYQRVVTAIYALPNLFRSSLNITGIRATDLYTLNTALGAAIEQSVVDNLNALRGIWDPSGEYQAYSFIRQPQAFPDVRLQKAAPSIDSQILMGIELKGWFALSKEGEPSFRYLITPAACAEADLLVVLPWILDEIVSGSPRLMKPFVTEARYAAEYRNHYWTIKRGISAPLAQVNTAVSQVPYPAKVDRSNDSALSDAGKNFGRVARSGIMQSFITEMMSQPVAGIPLGAWQRFIKLFSDGFEQDLIMSRVERISVDYAELIKRTPESQAAFDSLVQSIEILLSTLT